MKNLVVLIGYLGRDPESRDVNGKTVYNFSLATSETYKDKSGEKKTVTEWHNITAWNMKICDYLQKGSLIYLEGSVRTRSYEKDGGKKYITEIIARDIRPLSKAEGKPESKQQPVDDEINDDLPF